MTIATEGNFGATAQPHNSSGVAEIGEEVFGLLVYKHPVSVVPGAQCHCHT